MPGVFRRSAKSQVVGGGDKGRGGRGSELG